MTTRLRVLLIAIPFLLIAAFASALFLSERNLPQALPNAQWIYAGTTTLDRNGDAIIEVPPRVIQRDNVFNYFVLGETEPMPYIRIKSELHDNSFSITGGTPGKVAAWEIIAHSIKSK